jgi:hypothetical protein
MQTRHGLEKPQRGAPWCFVLFGAVLIAAPVVAVGLPTARRPRKDHSTRREETLDTRKGLGKPFSDREKDAPGVGKDTAGVGKDTAGAGKDTAGVDKDTAGAGKDTGGVGKDTAGAGKDTAGAGKDTAGVGKDTAGVGKDTAGAGKDTAGAGKDTAGAGKDTAGAGKDTAGVGEQTAGSPRKGATPNKTATQHTVLILFAKGQHRFKELLSAARSQLSDAPVTVEEKWVDALPKTLPERLLLAQKLAHDNTVAVVWCDLGQKGKKGKKEQKGQTRNNSNSGKKGQNDQNGNNGDKSRKEYLYLAEPKNGRVLVRSLPGASPEAQIEAAAIIVRASVLAFLRERVKRRRLRLASEKTPSRTGTRRGTRAHSQPRRARLTSARMTRRRAAPVGQQPHNWLSLELGYGYDTFATTHPAVHALWMAAAVHLTKHWTVFGGFRLTLPMHVTEAALDTTLYRHPASMGVRFFWPLSAWRIGASVELILDYLKQHTTADGSIEINRKHGDLIVATAALFLLTYRIHQRLDVVAAVGLEMPFNRKRYVLQQQNAETTVLLDPWPVHPRASLGLSIHLF